MVLILKGRATPEQVAEMLQVFETYIKLAVDVEREIVSLINIRPKQDNPSLDLQSPQLRERVERIVRRVFEGD